MENNPVLEQQANYLKELEEASKQLRAIGNKLYLAKKTDNDVNLFSIIVDTLKKISKEKAQRFEIMIKSIEPNIEEKIDTVQKLIISDFLITRLYQLKAEDPGFNILPILTLIPYYMDNESFTECMVNHTLPLLVNSNVI